MQESRDHRRTLVGFTAGIMAGISYGLNPLFGKPLLEGGVPVLSMLFFRYSISAFLVAIWMMLRKETFKVTWREFRLLVVLGIFFAASSVFLFESYKFIPTGLATTLVYLYPIFVAVIMLFLKVYPTWQVWLSIVATVGGVAILSLPRNGVTLHWAGMLMSALSALCYSFFLIIVNRSQRIKHISEHALTFYALVVGGTIFLGYQIIDGTPIIQGIDRPSEIINILGLAIFPTMISMLTLSMSTRLIGPTKTAVLGVFEPITGILVGTMVFSEPVTTNIIIGITICIAAVLFMVINEKRQKG